MKAHNHDNDDGLMTMMTQYIKDLKSMINGFINAGTTN